MPYDDFSPPITATPAAPSRRMIFLALAILAVGMFLRIYPSAGFTGVGFDEALYRDYAVKIDKVGFLNFPAICEVYLEDQRNPQSITKLPPTRFLYIASAWAWKRLASGDAPPVPSSTPHLAGDPYLSALHGVSCLSSILLLAVAGLAAWRLLGPRTGLGVLALMACAPTQIHMSQHALIDGFFALFAMLSLWSLWECLRQPKDARWLGALGASLALMVLTKENAFFVFAALLGLLAANCWTRFGQITPRLLLVLIAGPLAGLVVLVALAGGLATFVEMYRLLVSKAGSLRYAVMTGDGPWYRYLVDLMLVSPVILCLALGGLFTSVKESRPLVYLTLFMGLSYAIMCNVKFGMNLRYATIWDLPLRGLAVAQISVLAQPFGRRAVWVFALLIAAVGAYELRQYLIFFRDFGLYELASEGLLRAVKILK